MSLLNKENANAIAIWVFIGLVTIIGGLAALNARNYVEDIAAEVYKEQGLPPSETKQRLTEIETKLAGVEGDVSEVREDIRALIQAL